MIWVYTAETKAEIRNHAAVEILRQVWAQQYYIQDEEIFWRKTDNMPAGERIIHSPYDTEARFSIKRQTEWFGYKVHLTETCEDDQPNLITHVETTPATTQDVQMTDLIHQALEAKNLLPSEHFLDRGYVDTDILIDSQLWTNNHKDNAGNPRIYVRFAKNTCQSCPVRSDCTRSSFGPRVLSFKPIPQFELLQWARQREHIQIFKDRYAKRAGIEGTISQATRSFDMRRSRYFGLAKTHLQHILTAVAINLSRFVNWIDGAPRAATRTSAFAALALP